MYAAKSTGCLEGGDRIPRLVEAAREAWPPVERVHTVPDYVGNWAAVTRGDPSVLVISGGEAVAQGRGSLALAQGVGSW